MAESRYQYVCAHDKIAESSKRTNTMSIPSLSDVCFDYIMPAAGAVGGLGFSVNVMAPNVFRRCVLKLLFRVQCHTD